MWNLGKLQVLPAGSSPLHEPGGRSATDSKLVRNFPLKDASRQREF
jgi:hypothetical protein